MKYASICSGIEAASVAWHPLGWTPVLFSEIEPFPCAVLAERFPGVPNLGDMTAYREWPEELLAEVDVLVGGTPCQAFSVAGKRQSLGDERGNLTLVFVNIWRRVNEVRRKHGRRDALVVWENVPGVLNTRDNAFGCFIGALLGLDEAPEAEAGRWPSAGFLAGEAARVGWRVLDAQYFGVAQRRRRVFLIASTGEPVGGAGTGPCPSEVLALRESRPGDPPPGRQAGQATPGVAGAGAAPGCWWDGGQVSQTLDAVLQKGQTMPEKNRFPAVLQPHAFYSTGGSLGLNAEAGVSPTITVGSGLGIPSPPAVAFPQQPAPITPTAAYRWQNNREGLVADEAAPSVRASTGNSGFHEMNHPVVVQQPAVQGVDLFNQQLTGEVHCPLRTAGGHGAPAALAPTITSSNDPSRSPQSSEVTAQIAAVVSASMQVRRLTPRECERLQGFPDDWTAIPYRGKPASECPDGPRYKAIGNSMAVPCMAWLGRQIVMAMKA